MWMLSAVDMQHSRVCREQPVLSLLQGIEPVQQARTATAIKQWQNVVDWAS
jgi:hypothetical protein